MKKTGLIFSITFIIWSVFWESCSNRTHEENAADSGIKYDLVITRAQFEAMKMETGAPVISSFEEAVKVNGMIVPEPGGKAKMSPFIPGTVKSILVSPGSYVEKGKTVCVLYSQEAIRLQQEFAETNSLHNRLSADYQRVKTLLEEKVGAQKEYLAVESEYLANRSKYQALSRQLELIGMNPKVVADGKISAQVNLVAPISGFIISINGVIGQYIEAQSVLIEMVDQDKLTLKLSVFVKDISGFKKGQPIRFYNPGNRQKSGLAELVSVGKSIDPETKTIDCYAEISANSTMPFIDGEYVEAEVVISAREAMALPSEAVQKSANGSFVYVKQHEDKEAWYFIKKYVETGLITENLTEITDTTGLKEVLIKGTDTLTFED